MFHKMYNVSTYIHSSLNQCGLLLIYIIKQYNRLCVTNSRPNGLTDWADIFCGHSWVARGCFKLKKNTKKEMIRIQSEAVYMIRIQSKVV